MTNPTGADRFGTILVTGEGQIVERAILQLYKVLAPPPCLVPQMTGHHRLIGG